MVDGRPKDAHEAGSIPQTKNLPFGGVFDEKKRFKAKENLEELFRDADIDLQVFSVGAMLSRNFIATRKIIVVLYNYKMSFFNRHSGTLGCSLPDWSYCVQRRLGSVSLREAQCRRL